MALEGRTSLRFFSNSFYLYQVPTAYISRMILFYLYNNPMRQDYQPRFTYEKTEVQKDKNLPSGHQWSHFQRVCAHSQVCKHCATLLTLRTIRGIIPKKGIKASLETGFQNSGLTEAKQVECFVCFCCRTSQSLQCAVVTDGRESH